MDAETPPNLEIPDPEIVIGRDTDGDEYEDLAEERDQLNLHAGEGVALCLSGGGIRSATFSLGVLQMLAKLGWLRRFDYLSTVSGGGYIGSWLTAWIRRKGIDEVANALAGNEGASGHGPIHRLRASSNYLSPRAGLSSDLFTLVSTFVRNLLINWAILVPALVALTMIPLILVGLLAEVGSHPAWASDYLSSVFLGLAACFVVVALAYTASDLPDGNTHQTKNNHFRLLVFFPILVACYLVSLGIFGSIDSGAFLASELAWLDSRFWLFAGVGTVVHLAGAFVGELARARRVLNVRAGNAPAPDVFSLKNLVVWLFVGLAGAFAGVVIFLSARLASNVWETLRSPAAVTHAETWPALYSTFAVPFLLGCFFLASVVYAALIRRNTGEGAREWWGRSGGTWLFFAMGWIAVHVVCIWLPAWLSQFGAAFSATTVGGAGTLGGVLVAVVGYYSKNKSDPGSASRLGVLEKLNIGLLDLLSLAFIVALVAAIVLVAVNATADLGVKAKEIPAAFFGDLNVNVAWKMVILLVGGLLAWSLSWVAGVNTFSLHAMYGNRLVRAYLGASRNPPPMEEGRTPHGFTGFDPDDDLPLACEVPIGICRPFHVINTALNIVKDSADHLEWQERKAASFTMTPLRTGSRITGYCRTRSIGGCDDATADPPGPGGVTVGRAMTISGAAAAPNMGFHSSRLVAIVMTFFNVRLGWWMRNPAPLFLAPTERAQWRSRPEMEAGAIRRWTLRRRRKLIGGLCDSEPADPLKALFQELAGDTRCDSDYVYLSDGGHFENLGLYEMVRRRCREIVVVDAGCDPHFEYEDLERAIRIIRNDFNADIEIPDLPTEESIARTGRHYAVGNITYRGGLTTRGRILYIKPGLSGREPLDVTRYAARCRAKGERFPHQSTADQFFDEPQFESYRALGQFSVSSLASAAPNVASVARLIGAAGTAGAASRSDKTVPNQTSGGMREALSSLVSWDKLPGLLASVLGTGAVVSVLASDPAPGTAPGEDGAPGIGIDGADGRDGAAVGGIAGRDGRNRISLVYLLPEGGRVSDSPSGLLQLQLFQEGSDCPSGARTCDDAPPPGDTERDLLDALDNKLAECGREAPLSFTVRGFASTSDFTRTSRANGGQVIKERDPESDRLNLELADRRAAHVARRLAKAMAINTNKGEAAVLRWLPDTGVKDPSSAAARMEAMRDRLYIDTAARRTAGRLLGIAALNRRVDIEFSNRGACSMDEIHQAIRIRIHQIVAAGNPPVSP